MGMETLIVLVLAVLLIGGLPFFTHSRNWGYGPSAMAGVVLAAVLVLLVLGKL